MFKKLTNVRPTEKNEDPQLSTTTTKGSLNVNAAGASKMQIGAGDYLLVIQDEDTNSQYFGFWATKGKKATNDSESNVGAKLSNGSKGSLNLSSGSVFNSLDGSEDVKKIFTIGDAVSHSDFEFPIYKLMLTGEKAKSVRKKKEATA